MKDLAASIRVKLQNLARSEKKDFALVSRLYMQEGVLRRIGSSEFVESFYLKGGLLLYSLSGFKSRPTMDIDLLGSRVPREDDKFRIVLSVILSQPTDDGLNFDIDKMSLEESPKARITRDRD